MGAPYEKGEKLLLPPIVFLLCLLFLCAIQGSPRLPAKNSWQPAALRRWRKLACPLPGIRRRIRALPVIRTLLWCRRTMDGRRFPSSILFPMTRISFSSNILLKPVDSVLSLICSPSSHWSRCNSSLWCSRSARRACGNEPVPATFSAEAPGSCLPEATYTYWT